MKLWFLMFGALSVSREFQVIVITQLYPSYSSKNTEVLILEQFCGKTLLFHKRWIFSNSRDAIIVKNV